MRALPPLGSPEGLNGRWREGLALQPNDPKSAYNLALTQAQTGQKEAALANYQAAPRFARNYAQAWNNLGVLLKAMNRPDEAKRAFQQALAINPDLSEAQRNLAIH